MLRTAAKRAVLPHGAAAAAAAAAPRTTSNYARLSTSAASSSQTSPNQTPTPQIDPASPRPETPYYADSTPSRSSSNEEAQRHQRKRPPTFDYQEEQARVLQASLRHVKMLGWSEGALIAGAKEVGVSPSIVGSFPRKGAALVEYFMDDCLQRLTDRIDSEDLSNLIPSERISKLVRIRLEKQAPYISKWPEALAIQSQPVNVPTSFKQRAMLMDEIWHAAGDESSDIDWYVKRTILGGIYSTTEVYMLTDSSPEFRDTWAFLDNRVKDAFDLKKTIQEAKYLAEAVGAGMGNSLQGFVNRVMQR
ncbi:ubiquinone biosynthesis protein COQ9-B, mitochondrial [Punica granatum]|nr:ubiquinone biosynthesis protein COQ9-B, mitochondrial [Punica granatum]